MNPAFKKSVIIFTVCSIILLVILFLIPINLFDGEIIYNVNGLEFTREARLSLSYFIGIGANPEQLKDVVEFHLTSKGIFLALIVTLGIPFLIAYRTYLKATTPQKK